MQSQSLYSRLQEFKCIKTLTAENIPTKVRIRLFGQIQNDWFHDPNTKLIFKRIENVVKTRMEIPTFDELVSDPVLDEEAREDLAESETKPCSNKKSIKIMIGRLRTFRKIRHVYNMAKTLASDFDSDSFDVDRTISRLTDSLVSINTEKNVDEHIYSHGKDKNAEKIIEAALNDEDDDLMPSGFKAFDERAGGLPTEGVMVLAATTSGGKSAVSMQLGLNLCDKSNKKVVRISLEMGDKQEVKRMLSNLSGIEFYKFKQNCLSQVEKENAREAYRQARKRWKSKGACYAHWSPKRSITFPESLALIQPSKYDVIIADYISLFEGVDTDQQWLMLSKISKQAKVFSRENKCLVILLCQLNDETDRLRYSQGIKENADVMWRWNYTKEEQRDLKVLPIKQDKCRDGEIFDFDLAEKFHIMTVCDLDDSYSNEDDDEDDYESGGSKVINMSDSRRRSSFMVQ